MSFEEMPKQGHEQRREYAGAVSAVLSQPELPPREESPLSATSEGRTDDEKKDVFPDSPAKILELSLLWTQAVPSFRSLSESEKKDVFPDSPAKILELSLLWTQAVPSFRSLSESEKVTHRGVVKLGPQQRQDMQNLK
ncbi:hypothetical protein ANCDUO_12564 [Ancylostoma duodenale]|uniref:Uncharacterized protein n=1 Tax=Ancylostoma duodenale TaxID=51022 RepID=A0A0C2G8D2_9BILA|nr:hypothetical protein ANCDUO_12564 [Ancylostoma duodenale]